MPTFVAPIFAALMSAAVPSPIPQPLPVPVLVGDIVPIERPGTPFVEQRFAVVPNVVAMAANARELDLQLPWTATQRFQVRAFTPEAGFTFNEDGTVTPSGNPADLTYYLQANGPAGQLFVTVRGGRVTADLVGADPASIRLEAGEHVLDDLDRAYLGSATCGVEATTADSAMSAPIERALVPHAPRVSFEVTIMVAYTPQALAYAGSVQAIRDRAAASINQLNTALQDSGQTIHVRVVQVGDVFATPVNEITYAQQPNPGFRHKAVRNATRIDNPTTDQRDALDADLVVTLVADSGNPPGFPPVGPQYGVAFLQYPNCDDAAGGTGCNPGSAFREWAFAVVAFDFATNIATFAHEVGHLFGAEHEPARGSAQGFRSELYPYGHRVPGAVRDIMAQPECVPDTGSTVCTATIAVQFSNPDKLFASTSHPSGTLIPVYPADGARVRNGSRIIREYAPAMSDFEGGTQQPARQFWDGFE